ncbi:hypothetical protein DDE82_007552 [Stemphylium lycopersici]|nr:hypothetical protein TW65_04895 [Stemphylium lycopersici]RAR00169.1 hypothetical protein DDE82_007552 [Stemphylium lycopersici]
MAMMVMFGICAFLATLVHASPIIQDNPKLLLIPRAPEKYGEPIGPRTSFVVTSKIQAALCSTKRRLTWEGYRIRALDRNPLKTMTLTQVYVLIQYLLSIGYVFSAAVVHNGISLSTVGSCKAAMRLCLIFYAGSKVSMYLFLVERAHALRAPYVARYRDLLWLLSTIGIFASLGFIGIAGCVAPLSYLDEDDGRCRMGVRRYTAIPLMTCDIVINIFLTLVFVYLLSPLLRGSQSSGHGFASLLAREIGNLCGRADGKTGVKLHRSSEIMAQKVEKLLWKTFIGCVLVVIPTAGNLASLCILVGKELAFVSHMSPPVTWKNG